MQQVTMSAEVRSERGSAVSRQLRRSGRVPGVVYGHKESPVSIVLKGEDAHRVVAHRVKMVDLTVGGKTELVLVKDVQFDTFGEKVLHMDFERIALDEVITVECPVELVGTSKGAAAGGVVEHPVTDLEVSCLPRDIPDVIKVAISHLEIGNSIHVRDIPAPEGVKILTNPDSILVTIRAPAKVEEAAVAAAPVEGAPTEPEVIKREKPEEFEDEEAGKKEKKG